MMRTGPKNRHFISAMVLGAFFAMPLYAIAQTEGLPQVMEQNSVTYVTGGIGDDEVAALDAAKSDFNLHILNANSEGGYVSNTHIVITDKAGNELVSSDAGPLFYAKLPTGKYMVTATRHSEIKTKTLQLTKARSSKINFAWKTIE